MSDGRGPLGGLRSTLPGTIGESAAGYDPLAGGETAGREYKPRLTCPLAICDGSGWVVGPEDIARACECRQRRIERARASGLAGALPKRYRGVSFDRPPVSEMSKQTRVGTIVREVRSFCDTIGERLSEGRGIWLEGDPGTGKTTLAMLISKAALEQGHTAAIYSMPRLLSRIRETYSAEVGEDSYARFFERLTAVDLLQLDDLGAENRTEWVLEQLYAIVDRRYEDRRSIVITTNLPIEQLEEQIGSRTVSRLAEICGEALHLPGKDKRMELVEAPGPDDR
jgi:DNA replication protein DnaC